MAQQRKVVLLDDLDGTEAEQTVTFSLDGQQYEIDLSTENVRRLHEVLAPFTASARTAHRTNARRNADQPTPPAADVTEPADTATPSADAMPPAATPADEPRPLHGDDDAGDKDAADNGATARPGVPAALFSNPTQHVPVRAASAPRPTANGLFTTGG